LIRKEFKDEEIKTLEPKGRIKKILVDVISLLLRRSFPERNRREFIRVLSFKLETLYDEYLGTEKNVGSETLAKSITQIFNDLDGCFDFEINNNEITLIGTRCPWGNKKRRNPIICRLTKSIASRFAKRAWNKINVTITETLANRDRS
jgi:hypothetical protein